MKTSPKSKATKDESSKPKNDYEKRKALETPDVNIQRLPVNLNYMTWRNLPIIVLADVLGGIWHIIHIYLYWKSRGNVYLFTEYGPSNRPTIPTNESFTGYLVTIHKPITSYAPLSRGMMVAFW